MIKIKGIALNRGVVTVLELAILYLFNVVVFFDIAILRSVVGLIFLLVVPGFLLLQMTSNNHFKTSEKVLIAIGLSIVSIILLTLIYNNVSISLGFMTPLSTLPLLVVIDIYCIILIIASFIIRKDVQTFLSLPQLSRFQKSATIVALLILTTTLVGIYLLNLFDNSVLIILVFFLVAAYIIWLSYDREENRNEIYPIAILFIGLSLSLITALRGNHIFGWDSHLEYLYFQQTFNSNYWDIWGINSLMDSSLSISLVPAVYQYILSINAEFFFNIFYPVVFSFAPVCVFQISRRYITDPYAFLASIFFISQTTFLYSTSNSRIVLATYFAFLIIMVLFAQKPPSKSDYSLTLLFFFGCIVSHYSTAIIFFFLLLGVYTLNNLFSRSHEKSGRSINGVLLIVFACLFFFWEYQIVGGGPFRNIVNILSTSLDINNFFLSDVRSTTVSQVFGQNIQYSLINFLNFILKWTVQISIGFGILIVILSRFSGRYNEKYRDPEINLISNKIDYEFLYFSIISIGILIVGIVLPYLFVSYDIIRTYLLLSVFFAPFFIVGGVGFSRVLERILNTYIRSRRFNRTEKHFRIPSMIVILAVLIPFFLFTAGVPHHLINVSDSPLFDSNTPYLNKTLMTDQESMSAKWLGIHTPSKDIIIPDPYGGLFLESQAGILPNFNLQYTDSDPAIGKYIYYLTRDNINSGKVPMIKNSRLTTLPLVSERFQAENKLYTNAKSEAWGSY